MALVTSAMTSGDKAAATIGAYGESWKQVAAGPAAAMFIVSTSDLSGPIGSIKELQAAGKALLDAASKAERLRSLLRTAYKSAADAALDPNVPRDATSNRDALALVNQAASIVAVRGAKNPGRRLLSDHELGAFLLRIRGLETPAARAVELAIFLGGQRARQLLRVQRADFDQIGWTILLLDGKGNRETPRLHLLPVFGRARTLLLRCDEIAVQLRTQWLFSSTGKLQLDSQTVVSLVAEQVLALQKAGVIHTAFSYRDFRRTVETRLARKFDEKTRAHLLSHGLAGVQARYYDLHEYFDEKTNALTWWHDYVERCVQEAQIAAAQTALSAEWTPASLLARWRSSTLRISWPSRSYSAV